MFVTEKGEIEVADKDRRADKERGNVCQSDGKQYTGKKKEMSCVCACSKV